MAADPAPTDIAVIHSLAAYPKPQLILACAVHGALVEMFADASEEDQRGVLILLEPPWEH